MVGGAAPGSFLTLDTDDEESFMTGYSKLRDMIRYTGVDGLDLNVEEPISFAGIVRLINHLTADFGPQFVITLAPFSSAMWVAPVWGPRVFDYYELDRVFRDRIGWYNTQFYCGVGNLTTTRDYDRVIAKGWPPEKVVAGLITDPKACTGWLADDVLENTVKTLREISDVWWSCGLGVLWRDDGGGG
jgi:hypothetical protein